MKKARRKLGEGGPAESVDAPIAPPAVLGRSGPGMTPAANDKSVESMLKEISTGGSGGTGGADAPVGGGPAQGKYDQLWQLSMADPHTGLANQLLLLDRLTQALVRRRRHGGEIVVCHIELDNLNDINLDLGYTTGNAVLCEVARRLTAVLRAEDTVARVGSSELVTVMAVTDEHVVGPLMRRLQHTLDEPVNVGGEPIKLESSLGVAVAEDDETAEDVLAKADRSTRVTRR